MGKREEINETNLDDVVGGRLRWQGGIVYPVKHPECKYTFTNYEACTDYIKNNWPGGEHNEDTLIWLESHGLVKKAY